MDTLIVKIKEPAKTDSLIAILKALDFVESVEQLDDYKQAHQLFEEVNEVAAEAELTEITMDDIINEIKEYRREKKLLAEVARIKNGDTKDFKTFTNTNQLAEYLGFNWQNLIESADHFTPDFMEDRNQPAPQERTENEDWNTLTTEQFLQGFADEDSGYEKLQL